MNIITLHFDAQGKATVELLKNIQQGDHLTNTIRVTFYDEHPPIATVRIHAQKPDGTVTPILSFFESVLQDDVWEYKLPAWFTEYSGQLAVSISVQFIGEVDGYEYDDIILYDDLDALELDAPTDTTKAYVTLNNSKVYVYNDGTTEYDEQTGLSYEIPKQFQRAAKFHIEPSTISSGIHNLPPTSEPSILALLNSIASRTTLVENISDNNDERLDVIEPIVSDHGTRLTIAEDEIISIQEIGGKQVHKFVDYATLADDTSIVSKNENFIYLVLDTKKFYYWNGSAYIETNPITNIIANKNDLGIMYWNNTLGKLDTNANVRVTGNGITTKAPDHLGYVQTDRLFVGGEYDNILEVDGGGVKIYAPEADKLVFQTDVDTPIVYIGGVLNVKSGDSELTEVQQWLNINNTLVAKMMNDGTFYANGLNISGDIIQQGSAYETHAEQVYTTKDHIIMRDGAVGALAVGAYTGLIAKIPDGVKDATISINGHGVAVVGDITYDGETIDYSDTQALATREDTPLSLRLPFWNATKWRFDTSPHIYLSTGANPPFVVNYVGHVANNTALQAWQVDGTTVVRVRDDGRIQVNQIGNLTDINVASITFGTGGTQIVRNINDANPALRVNQQLGTGNLADFQYGGVNKATIDKDGNIVGVNITASGYLNGKVGDDTDKVVITDAGGAITTTDRSGIDTRTSFPNDFKDITIANSVVGVSPLTVNAIADTTADLLKLQVGGVDKLKVDKDGVINSTSRNIITHSGRPFLTQSFDHAAGSVFLGRDAGTTSGDTQSSVAIGNGAGKSNNQAQPRFTAIGSLALTTHNSGARNNALGCQSGWRLTTGSDNIFIGDRSGEFLSNGSTDLTNVGTSIFIGNNTRSGNAQELANQIVIGHNAISNGSNTATIGNSDILGYYLNGNANSTTYVNNLDLAKSLLDNDGEAGTDGQLLTKVSGETLWANKPTYTLDEVGDGTTRTLATKADLVGGIVPSSQLPSYVDDVLVIVSTDLYDDEEDLPDVEEFSSHTELSITFTYGATEPISPTTGDYWYDTNEPMLKSFVSGFGWGEEPLHYTQEDLPVGVSINERWIKPSTQTLYFVTVDNNGKYAFVSSIGWDHIDLTLYKGQGGTWIDSEYTPFTGRIYIDTSTNKTYRFVKLVGLVEISQSLIPSFAQITDKPTTISGYGITDGITTSDSRLTDARQASDVYAWAKAETKPAYQYSEISGTKPTYTLDEVNDGTTRKLADYSLTTHTQAVDKGGTNITSYTAGDLLVATGATTLAKIPIGADDKILQVVSGAPAWTDKSGTYVGPTETLLATRTSAGDFSVDTLGDYDEIILELDAPRSFGETGVEMWQDTYTERTSLLSSKFSYAFEEIIGVDNHTRKGIKISSHHFDGVSCNFSLVPNNVGKTNVGLISHGTLPSNWEIRIYGRNW